MDVTPVVAAAPVAPVAPRARRARRWHRLVIPLAATCLFWLVVVVAHAYQEPDLADAGTLSPTGTGRHGSSELADKLAAEGVSVIRVTSSKQALAAARGDSTVFVPAPDLVDRWFIYRLGRTEGRHRIVLVRPSWVNLPAAEQVIRVSDSRWMADRATAGCQSGYPVGPALVRRDRYAWDEEMLLATACYGGSVLTIDDGDDQFILVGATEPFRNDRLTEDANAALATRLLGRHTRLIWLDVHEQENKAPLPKFELPQYRRGDRDRGGVDTQLFANFPAPLWAVLLLSLVGAALLGVARARRLGPPVAEPLPVLVPAAETVTGRGRLYHRIRARGTSMQTLRAAAVARLARALDPLARAPERRLEVDSQARDEFLLKVAARAGVEPDTARAILFGPPPHNDHELEMAAAKLDGLVDAVLAEPTTHPGGAP